MTKGLRIDIAKDSGTGMSGFFGEPVPCGAAFLSAEAHRLKAGMERVIKIHVEPCRLWLCFDPWRGPQ